MTCARCGNQNPDPARFCNRCGNPLVSGTNRHEHFAANPNEALHALALISTLMPHVSGSRHHLYRFAVTLCLGAAIVAAGFGILPVALVLAGIALPGALLVYLYDHDVAADEPASLVLLGVALAAALGVVLGFLNQSFDDGGLVLGINSGEPALTQLLLECLALPAVTLAVLQLVPLLLTIRPGLRHALDALTVSAISATVAALGESIVVQHGAFLSITVYGTDAARDTLVALCLGFAKPLVYATATAVALIRLRGPGHPPSSYAASLVEAFVLIGAYDSALATLAPYGQRGVVLTFLIAAALASLGLLRVRNEVHRALLVEAEIESGVITGRSCAKGSATPNAAAPSAAPTGLPAPIVGSCAKCGLALLQGASFCIACGAAVAAMPKPYRRRLAASAAGVA